MSERIAKASSPADLLPLISEAGRLDELERAHEMADTILVKLIRLLARRHPDEKAATEVARRFSTMDKRYYEP